MQKPNIVELNTQARETGANNAKKLRDEMYVPAVVYGPELKENVHFSVFEADLEKILSSPRVQIIKLKLEGGKEIDTILKKTEFHPVTDRPLHADFYALADKNEVIITVPIELSGTAAGITEGGRLFKPLRKIRVKCLPAQIPAELAGDISELKIGDSLHIRDLELEDVTPMIEADRTVATIKPPRGGLAGLESVIPMPEGEEEAEAAEEGAEVEGEAEAEEPAEE
ncbi:MAG TPA: 50S ribosomal protein L25 [Balneolales bacterium]|nr:50S ribosomal protein L25 [Balneolales bacterium]